MRTKLQTSNFSDEASQTRVREGSAIRVQAVCRSIQTSASSALSSRYSTSSLPDSCDIILVYFCIFIFQIQYSFLTGPSTKSSKEFPCTCGRKYKHYSSLYTHQKYECGKPPSFQCTFCPAAYKHKHRLKEHVTMKHWQLQFTGHTIDK
ncbi:zinc finger and BTB domain-containing protein 24-like [Macrosteles quadrilineatus]|uniref:zinc finger and BTB domain-containing protein 24-like n=1 Tax=Macrosteles quadrilineatus TaxID=74068 RepID=UPI0023E13634|nr:zinc finger and BTB domain-containing protein 24-like [Macrosteles quadrilineatus]